MTCNCPKLVSLRCIQLRCRYAELFYTIRSQCAHVVLSSTIDRNTHSKFEIFTWHCMANWIIFHTIALPDPYCQLNDFFTIHIRPLFTISRAVYINIVSFSEMRLHKNSLRQKWCPMGTEASFTLLQTKPTYGDISSICKHPPIEAQHNKHTWIKGTVHRIICLFKTDGEIELQCKSIEY